MLHKASPEGIHPIYYRLRGTERHPTDYSAALADGPRLAKGACAVRGVRVVIIAESLCFENQAPVVKVRPNMSEHVIS